MIYIVKHKPFQLPKLPEGYKTLCVGGYTEPDAIVCSEKQDNIEQLNLKINELTAFYYLWKNINDSIIGVEHYRRFLTNNNDKILTIPQIQDILTQHDAICYNFNLPFSVKWNIISSGLQGGPQAFNRVCERMPSDYKNAFSTIMNQKHYYVSNLIITRREIFNDYCNWLFSFIIDAANNYTRESDIFREQRAVGFIGEAMLSVWLYKNNINVTSRPMLLL